MVAKNLPAGEEQHRPSTLPLRSRLLRASNALRISSETEGVQGTCRNERLKGSKLTLCRLERGSHSQNCFARAAPTLEKDQRYSSTRFARQTTKAAKPRPKASRVSGPGTVPPGPVVGLYPLMIPIMMLNQSPMCPITIDASFLEDDYRERPLTLSPTQAPIWPDDRTPVPDRIALGAIGWFRFSAAHCLASTRSRQDKFKVNYLV